MMMQAKELLPLGNEETVFLKLATIGDSLSCLAGRTAATTRTQNRHLLLWIINFSQLELLLIILEWLLSADRRNSLFKGLKVIPAG
jgi:hypothetical protein